MHGCIRAAASNEEVCLKSKNYEIWETLENQKWMEEAISRGLQCANSDAGKKVANKMGRGYSYAPPAGLSSVPSFSSTTGETNTPYQIAKDYLDKSTELANEIYLQNREATQKAIAETAKGARQY